MNISRQQIDKLIVGTNDVSYVEPDISPTGTAVLNGPVYIGKPTAAPSSYEGFLNVASNAATQSPIDRQAKAEANFAIKTDGNVRIEGDGKTANGLHVTGGSSQYKLRVGGNAFFDHGNIGDLSSRFDAADASPKPFDLVHPTKGKGHRLRYACIEGPEVAVYHRGRLKGSNIIELPYYWKDLVHENSITVQLQPIGKSQNLVIESFNNEYVVIEVGANQDFLTGEILIDCFYHVYAERKDINPLITEYEGDSWKDYPDPNHYTDDFENRTYSHPDFNGPPNTITK